VLKGLAQNRHDASRSRHLEFFEADGIAAKRRRNRKKDENKDDDATNPVFFAPLCGQVVVWMWFRRIT
jgi:hypothetical protein